MIDGNPITAGLSIHRAKSFRFICCWYYLLLYLLLDYCVRICFTVDSM